MKNAKPFQPSEAARRNMKAAAESTLKELEERIGVSFGIASSLLKNGRRYHTIENIALLCQDCGYNPAWVLLGQSPRKAKKEKDPMERLGEIEKEIKALKTRFK